MNDYLAKIPSINTITPLKSVDLEGLQSSIDEPGQGKAFSSYLNDAIQEISKTQQEADMATTALVTGQIEDFHTPVIATEKASLTLGLAVTVRNKMLDAYHEIMRMQI